MGSDSGRPGGSGTTSTARSSCSSSTGPARRRRRTPIGDDATVTDDPADDYAFDTLAVHAGAEPDEATGALAPPIYPTSTAPQDGIGGPRRGYEYSRSQNPTRERLERAVATLEGARHGIA